MKLRDIEIPISNLAGVGPALAKLFAQVNVFTIADLFCYYPRDWDDRTHIVPLSDFSQCAKIHSLVQVRAHNWFGFGRMKTLKIIIEDEADSAVLVCFNRPFLEKVLPVGAIISITGSFSVRYGEIQSSSFEAICISKNGELSDFRGKALPDSAVYPIYPLTAGLGQGQVRKIINRALSEYARGIDDELPARIHEQYGFMHKKDAIKAMHSPVRLSHALEARRSLIFEELYHFQKTILSRAMERTRDMQLPHISYEVDVLQDIDAFKKILSPRQKQLYDRLNFALTPDQITVIVRINCDIDAGFAIPTKNESPSFHMARLLQGDVGSGKTLVAFFAALRIIDWGGQCAFLAPTEILARQHAENASKQLEPLIGSDGRGIQVAFLTGNIQNKGRAPLLKSLKSGDIHIIIGTHALFSKNVVYHNLRLVIIDEQHRFGVVQRNAIIDKGRTSVVALKNVVPHNPALLMMSATPIPQTLALTVYGDLDVSTIKTMPRGRKPIITHLTRQNNEARVYEAVRSELKKGRQAYFVYPRIENAEGFDESHEEALSQMQEEFAPQNGQSVTTLKSAEEMYTFLSKHVYPDFTCAIIHSKIDEQEQNRILHEFREGSIHVLVATSVVEVGVDIPNASCMVIEHAERFGLAALHQLRGRVGRGSEQSTCFLIYSTTLSELGKSRLKVMHESTDGFFIAEEDLRLRGPGEVTGIQQSGYLMLGLADPVNDKELLKLARKEVLIELGL